MKRFASHYLLIPDVGYIKQQVVEVDGEGVVRRIFPLTEEIESVEWMAGVIALFPIHHRMDEMKYNLPIVSVPSSQCPNELLSARGESFLPYLLYPFDFTSMQPVGETQHKLLR